ncbi:phospholipid-binding protein MlaC [Alkanindiges sp. WGS2144]|uniref:MlaC/ttg2D family ABC transporter substrate-binding protein n=1 Tax=Alkanindiges sp. WGS2144 TaxID=3366808 RepID=UPI003750B13F
MKFKAIPTALSTSMLAMMIASTNVQAAPEPAPVFVKRISDALVERLVKERPNYQKNPAVLNTIVKENIEPYVDFDGFARGVMGQYYRQATPNQRTSFTQTFRQSLIRTYAKGLTAYNNESYSIRPFTAGRDPSKAVVNMDFKTSNGNIPVTYQLVQSGDSWKVRNVSLNGIDIGLTFRNQFASTVQNSKGNLDAAIKNFTPSADAAGSK